MKMGFHPRDIQGNFRTPLPYLLVLGIMMMLSACVSVDPGLYPVESVPFEPLVEFPSQGFGLELQVRQIDQDFLSHDVPGDFWALYWTLDFVQELNPAIIKDLGVEDLELLRNYVFQNRPSWEVVGAYQEITFQFSDSVVPSVLVQNQQYSLAQGVGSLEPRPLGMISLVRSNRASQFLVFPDGSMIPVEWWVSEPEADSRDYLRYRGLFSADTSEGLESDWYGLSLFYLRQGNYARLSEMLESLSEQRGERLVRIELLLSILGSGLN